MTLGEKLNELRTQKGLSQLELAEALDVSRQSVSKWETDAAMPEVEKLVAISRYFGVSIGALLGVEEEAGQAREDDLTPEQLAMVEEIAGRYIAAMPKPMEKKRKLALMIVAAAAALCLVFGLYRAGRHLARLDDKFTWLQNSVNNLDSSVASRIDGITGRVESALEEQTHITADAEVELVSIDVLANTATVSMRATPKTFFDGMTAYFEIESGGERERVGPVAPDGTAFSARYAAALSDEIKVYVVFEHDGQRETQYLDGLYGLARDTVPSAEVDNIPAFTYYTGSTRVKVTGEWSVHVELFDVPAGDGVRPPVEIASVEVGLFRDHRLLWWAEPTDGAPSDWRADVTYSEHFFRYPDSLSGFEPGGAFAQGELCSVARVTDTFGRVFLYPSEVYVLGEDGTLDMLQAESFDPVTYGAPADDPSVWDFTPWE